MQRCLDDAAGRPAHMHATATASFPSAAATAPVNAVPVAQQPNRNASSTAALPASHEASAATPDLLSPADQASVSGMEAPIGNAPEPAYAEDDGRDGACEPADRPVATGAARSHLAPLNGRPSGQPSGRTLGLGRRAVLGHVPGNLAGNAGVHGSSHAVHTPGAATSHDSAGPVAMTKGLAGCKPAMQAPGSGGIRLQGSGMMGAGTPTYRVSGLRRSSGPRLHVSIGKGP